MFNFQDDSQWVKFWPDKFSKWCALLKNLIDLYKIKYFKSERILRFIHSCLVVSYDICIFRRNAILRSKVTNKEPSERTESQAFARLLHILPIAATHFLNMTVVSVLPNKFNDTYGIFCWIRLRHQLCLIVCLLRSSFLHVRIIKNK